MTPPKLEVRNISKTYRRGGNALTVLENLSLSVPELEFLVLLGPSGCGKSTLLRIIDGIESCDEGQIILDGQDVTGQTGHGRGMVFQSFELFPWRTTLENVAFGLEVGGMGKNERLEAARECVDLVGLSGFENAYPHELSGGMQQRVGIARALAIKPSILLMDEPYGALDVQTRDLLQDELLNIWEREKKTVIFVTHSIEEALYLADRIILMSPRPGRIDRIIEVPFARPRRDEIKTTPDFLALRREIWHSLKQGAEV
ncbi:nitrate ABC transporter ATP-binding protein [Agaricicola taiwanensis]|uniref:Nitrate ABC transporter ATP-binding protein n=1 Tax=Agaricicola taiwanensis TaxID=591372 RepID=A0A8J2YKS8_9RHOB|nr:ABC transporter ATP-binding protein [Agaricicola taiwanensis]GGE49132.1 nitrate ABC transporter ATP-binding protein [Agaricicola taiwanensis]